MASLNEKRGIIPFHNIKSKSKVKEPSSKPIEKTTVGVCLLKTSRRIFDHSSRFKSPRK